MFSFRQKGKSSIALFPWLFFCPVRAYWMRVGKTKAADYKPTVKTVKWGECAEVKTIIRLILGKLQFQSKRYDSF